MILYFIRHGETEWNVKKKIQGSTDIPLNDHGCEQAKMLAAQLVGQKEAGKFSAACVYTSPQLRAAKTAQAVAEALCIPCIQIEGLREMCMGEWEGMNWRRVRKKYKDFYLEWNADRRFMKTPHGESYNDMLERVLEALSGILEQEKENNVVVVTHSAVVMAVRCYINGDSFDEANMIGKYKTKNTEVAAIDAELLRSAIQRFHEEMKETS